MKRPRSFIALALFAFGFTIALSTVTPAVRCADAEVLPVLRVDPRMGDPDEPIPGRKQMPLDDDYYLLELDGQANLESPGTSTTLTRVPQRSLWQEMHALLHSYVSRGMWRWPL